MELRTYMNRLTSAVRLRLGIKHSARPAQLRMLRAFNAGEEITDSKLSPAYELVYYTPGCEGDWAGFMNASGEFGVWDERVLSEEILRTLLPQGGVLAYSGRDLVGCAAACRIEQFEPYATLMYVVVAPNHRGQGLGGAVTAGAVAASFKGGYPGMILQTDDYRIPAIKTYLKLGFRPDFEASPDAENRWQAILENSKGERN